MLPIESTLNDFLEEVQSVFKEVKAYDKQLLRDENLRERISELAISWSLSVIQQSPISEEKESSFLAKKFSELAYLSSKGTRKQNFYPIFREVERLLKLLIFKTKSNIELLSSSGSTPSRIVAGISDLPVDLFPKSLIGWKPNIEAFLKDKSFDKNIFIIVRYANESEPVIQAVKDEIASFVSGDQTFNFIIARETDITDDLYNPIACLLCCKYAIAIFDSVENKPQINPNVAYELGYMHLLQRKCLLLKDAKLSTLPTDVLHKLYKGYNTPSEVSQITREWLSSLVTQ